MDENELVEFEQRARRDVAGGLRATLDWLNSTVTAVYVTTAGDTRHKLPPLAQETIRQVLVDVLAELGRPGRYANIRGFLHLAGREALRAGAAHAGVDVPVRPAMPLDVRWALRDLTIGMRADIRDARRLARVGSLERYGDVQRVIALARAAVNRADRTASWVVNRAYNEGLMRAADRAGAARMWVPEPDACLTCLAYAGLLAGPGDMFPAGLTYGDSSTVHEPLWGPPAHPHCRCRLEAWYGPLEVTKFDMPYAVRREAQRKVAQGLAQGSEPALRRAADRLVDLTELLIPKSVAERGRRKARAGTLGR